MANFDLGNRARFSRVNARSVCLKGKVVSVTRDHINWTSEWINSFNYPDAFSVSISLKVSSILKCLRRALSSNWLSGLIACFIRSSEKRSARADLTHYWTLHIPSLMWSLFLNELRSPHFFHFYLGRPCHFYSASIQRSTFPLLKVICRIRTWGRRRLSTSKSSTRTPSLLKLKILQCLHMLLHAYAPVKTRRNA